MMLPTGMSKRKSPTNCHRANQPMPQQVDGASPPSPPAFTTTLRGADLKPILQVRTRKRVLREASVITRLSIPGSLAAVVVFVVVFWVIGKSPITKRQYFEDPFRRRRASVLPFPRVTGFLGQDRDASIWDYFVDSLFLTASSTGVSPLIPEKRQKRIEDSSEYLEHQTDAFETKDCKAMFPWQLQTFPTCNSLHETDMAHAYAHVHPPTGSSLVFLTSGFWRDVWLLHNATSLDGKAVLKTQRFMHIVTERNFDRNRRDALVMERLTKSRWILNVYGFCGNTGLYEYADGGDISTTLWPESQDALGRQLKIRTANNLLTHQHKLEIACQAAFALAELHNFDKEGQASVAHADISPAQFVITRGRLKLQDFNRARFLTWNKDTNQTCPFTVTTNPGKNRSPEEYAYGPQTEKVDVYSLGNLFYMLLQMEWPFKSEKTQEAKDLVKQGFRPSFYEDVWNSMDPYDMALKEAMLMCHEQEAEKRSSAREVANYLKTQLDALNPGVVASWGEPTHH